MNSSNRATKEDILRWIEPTLKRQNFHDYVVNVAGSSEKGDGYLGDITFVDVTNNEDDKTLNFVVKSGKKSNQLREMMPVRNAFENEVYFYSDIFPTFIKFQEKKGIQDLFDNAPKCYDTSVFEDMEVLILENMRKSGYSLHDRTKPMTLDHIETVIKTYGKLHAISFALRDQKPEIFQKLTSNLKDIFKIISETVKQPEEVKHMQDIINIAKKKQEFDIVDKTLKLQEESKKLNNLTDPSDPYAVILHGDCWNNNFMFKYEDTTKTKVSRVCLLDFQISRLASPVYDLSYFLFTCISEEDLKSFDKIVDIYYESFSSFLRQLGSDPDKMFPYEELMKQWQRFSKFGLSLMPSLVRICLAEQEEVSDLAEAAESGVEISDAFTYTVKNIEEYERRTLPVLRLAIDKNFI